MIMNYSFVLTNQARCDLKKIPVKLELKIRRKILYYLSTSNPMVFAKPLVNLPPATHRFRFGNIRIKFFRKENIFYITAINFRGRIYKR